MAFTRDGCVSGKHTGRRHEKGSKRHDKTRLYRLPDKQQQPNSESARREGVQRSVAAVNPVRRRGGTVLAKAC